MRVLAGDIGGTNSRLAVFEAHDERLEVLARRTFPSERYDGLGPIVREFLAGEELECRRACFGVAGPVRGREAKITNLPWVIGADVLESGLGLERVFLLNDLEAAAWGIPALAPDELVTLHRGAEGARGNRALIAAGTGLGEAGLYWDGRHHLPWATEGGHADLAPGDDVEARLLAQLRAEHGHVSWERVVSGPGLVTLHDFLRHEAGGEAPGCPAAHAGPEDAAAAITRAALERECPLCVETLDRFVRLLAAEAGNLALKVMARGGVYVGGGIAPKILPALTDGRFVAAFLDKGRMRAVVEEMPLHVILNDQVALLGAARRAAMP